MSSNTKSSATGNESDNFILNSGLPLIYKVENDLDYSSHNRKGEFVRTQVNSLSVFQKEAIVTSARAGQSWRFTSDEGKYLMGHDAAPAPLAFLTVGMVASYMTELLALAKIRGVEIRDVKLVQDNYYSMEGSMRQGTMMAGADHVDLEVKLSCDAPAMKINELILDAVAASPLNGLMRGENESLFTLTHNGTEIDPNKALKLSSPGLEDPGAILSLPMADGEWDEHAVKGGITPLHKNSDSGEGTSLTDHQSRLLHLRGICTLRPDGVKVIEQQLYNPHGSIFTFLSDEGESDGGKGRAPNAASYISAGIGFCFMTQFGRFAKMNKSKLEEYRIIQDAHFSLGGASGKTGKPGEADSLETHVYLKSTEEDDDAKYMLDMSEQTCFLHAFCRTDLKTKVKVTSI